MLDEPLGLTVHSLPVPQEAAEADSRRTSTGRMKMLLVLVVCAAPVIASYFTYYVVHPGSAKSFGTLVEPRGIPDAKAIALDGKAVPLASLKGQWLLVSVASGACDALCEKNLYLQRQLRESLGRDKDRVDWVWLVDDAAPVRPQLASALSQATVLRVDASQLAQWLAPEAGHSLHEHLYVVDPMGRWMMRFPAASTNGLDTAAAKNMKRDLERLLRASASWDQPGR